MSNKTVVHHSDPEQKGIVIFTLFTTTGTLVCCALPILFVTIGLGTTVVAMTSAFPFLMVLSQHKIWVFIFSGIMLFISGWLIFRSGRICPADGKSAQACHSANRWNKRIYWTSVVIWTIGFSAAYLLLPIRIWLKL